VQGCKPAGPFGQSCDESTFGSKGDIICPMPKVTVLMAIAIGGAAGAVLRFAVSRAMQALLPHGYPVGTFVVNMAGCLAIGFCVARLKDRLDEALWLGLVVGFLGAFTTFSTYSIETYELAKQQQIFSAAVNSIGSVVVGLAAVWFGIMLGSTTR
jgi:CrcB protein